MKIDEIDFTPWYFGRGDCISVMSKDEYEFIRALYGEYTWWSCSRGPSWAYLKKLTVYYERFNNHMPIPIRKELLRSIMK